MMYSKEWYQKNKNSIKKAVKKWQRKDRKLHPEKYRNRFKDYYNKNKKQFRKISKKWEINLKKKLVNILGGKCSICGYNKCIAALDFHHINPEEKKCEREWRNKTKYFMKLIKEGKIKLLCSNCHREEHNKT